MFQHVFRTIPVLAVVALLTAAVANAADAKSSGAKTFKAGAAIVDITPTKLPVVPRGNFFPKPIDKIKDPLYARCLILHDGESPIVFFLIDCCTLSLPIVEKIKSMIVDKTGIPKNRILVAATHTHSAPAVVVKAAEGETRHTLDHMTEAAVQAQKNLEPAKVGWAVGDNRNNVFCRRFLMKKGTARTNPFGGTNNDRAQMNPGYDNPNRIARTGPVDTAVSVLSILTAAGKPLAVMGNYSTHYAGVPADEISGDYFGVFALEMQRMIAEKVGKDKVSEKFVGIMTNGTSGDANCRDYWNKDQPKYDIFTVGRDTAAAAMIVWPNIEYFDWVPLRMAEKRITIDNRLPTPEEMQAAKDHIAKLPGGQAKTISDSYAFNTVRMEKYPKTSEIVLQAMQIGELGVTGLPGEIYGSTGLEIKARSPFWPTVNISLANGHFGYIPPPAQHKLGGYNVWRRPGCCLAPDAEPKIKDTVVDMLKTLHAVQ